MDHLLAKTKAIPKLMLSSVLKLHFYGNVMNLKKPFFMVGRGIEIRKKRELHVYVTFPNFRESYLNPYINPNAVYFLSHTRGKEVDLMDK